MGSRPSFYRQWSERNSRGFLGLPLVAIRPGDEALDLLGILREPGCHLVIVRAAMDEVTEGLYELAVLHLHEIRTIVIPGKAGAFLLFGRFRQNRKKGVDRLHRQLH